MIKGLSVVIITKNEEANLKDCLKSVRWADEIIIIDNYSLDNTLQIAKKFTDKIFLHKENNLGLQKRYALRKTSKEWILMLDADERVSKQLAKEIKNKIIRSDQIKYDAFNIKYQNHFLGKPVNFGGENYIKTRIFRKQKGAVSSDPIHEEVIIHGKIEALEGKILHYSYRNIPQAVNKFRKYAKIMALTKFKKGEKASFSKLISYPLHMFYARSIKEKGYKDGMAGLVLSGLFAYMEFLIYFYLLLFALKIPLLSCNRGSKKI